MWLWRMITDPWERKSRVFTVTGKISRKELGVTYNAATNRGSSVG